MPEEYIMSSKACVYVLGGAANTAALFDFDGVYILDGGFAEKSQGFVAHVRNVSAVLLSAPTLGNLGTTTALLEKDKSLPVFTNTKPFKTAKPGSSGELVKSIQEANSKLLSVSPPLFNPKYPAHIIYQSAAKGILSLYILAGDVKDAEVITKALVSGNESEVEKAAAEHGTIGVLLWRPAQADNPAVRVLISGTSSLARIQQSLDKAAKSLPFLNAPTVKSKDALTDIPAPAGSKATAPSSKPTGRPSTASSARPAVPAGVAAAPRAMTSRPLASNGPAASRPATRPAPAAPASRTAAPSRAPAPKAAAPAKAPARSAAPPARAPARAPATKPSEPIAQKKTVGKAQGAAPSKQGAHITKKAPTPPSAAPAPIKAPAPVPVSPPAQVAPPPPSDVTIVLDDSLITPEDMNQGIGGHGPMDIVVIPPTPEPPRSEDSSDEHKVEEEAREETPKHEPVEQPEPLKEVDDVANLADVEDEIPQPVDAFKKPEPEPEPKPEPVDDKEDEVPKPVDAFKKPDPEPVDDKSKGTNDVEDEVPEPVDAFKKPDPQPVYPNLDDFDPIKPSHPEPSAPEVPGDHVIISNPDHPDIVAAVPFIPPTPCGTKDDGLIQLDDDVQKLAPGFEEPLIPQTTQIDGTLADCNEEVSKLVEISMDTDKVTDKDAEINADIAKAIGEVTQLSAELQNLGLDEKTDDYVRKLSNQMIQEATLPFTSALATTIVSHHGSVDDQLSSKPNGHSSSNGVQDHQKEMPKHDLMQARSSVIENGTPVEYEKADPVLDDVLNACAQESEKLDAVASTPPSTHHPDILHMPAAPGVPLAAKPVKFARPYYFDVVTVPRNEKLETTVSADGLQEFMSKIRSRNVILASKDISGDQLQSMLHGKQTWCDKTHPCTVIPTHSSPILLDFRQKSEADFANNHLSLAIPVEKQRTTVSSEAGAVEYELARIALV